MAVVLGHKDRRARPDLLGRRAIPAQLVKWDLRDPKVRRVKRDRRDQRAIQVQLVKRDLKVRKDPKALKAQLVRLGQLLNPRSALLPDQTARLCAVALWSSMSGGKHGDRLVR